MVDTIRYPRAFLNWQARVAGTKQALRYRVSHDGRGNWTVTEPGAYNDKPIYFPADDPGTPSSEADGNAARGVQAAPLEDAQASTAAPLSPAEKHAAEVRGSYPDLSA
ncbi:hypothetical protein MPLSOD_20039 [Mesorhizobium sp. SOD10]|nr:hypothetical protein MPLSOD_20039 [Mesorhizobium sp. SOD10]